MVQLCQVPNAHPQLCLHSCVGTAGPPDFKRQVGCARTSKGLQATHWLLDPACRANSLARCACAQGNALTM